MNQLLQRSGMLLMAVLLMSWPIVTPAQTAKQSTELTQRESKAVRMMRTIASAEATYLAQHGRAATLDQLVEATFLDDSFSNGSVHDGYRLWQVNIDEHGKRFEFKAEPAGVDEGRYAFNVIDDYIIRFARGSVAPNGNKGKVLGSDPL